MSIALIALVLGMTVLVLTVGAAAGTWWLARNRLANRTYIDRRISVLTEQAAKAPKGATLIIGDSITERAWIQTLCGRPAFNGGVSGAKTGEMIKATRALVNILQPSLVIIALGANDADKKRETERSVFMRDYEDLLEQLSDVRVLMVSVLGVELMRSSRPFLSQSAIERENRDLTIIARRHGIKLARLPRSVRTLDGVHPDVAGSAAWLAAIEGSCLEGRRSAPIPTQRQTATGLHLS